MAAAKTCWGKPQHMSKCKRKCHQKSHNCGACLEGNVDAWNAPLICLWPHNGTVELLLEGLIAACEAGALPLKEGPINTLAEKQQGHISCWSVGSSGGSLKGVQFVGTHRCDPSDGGY